MKTQVNFVSYMPEVDFRLSDRASQFILFTNKEANPGSDIVIVCPEVLDDWVAKGALVKRGRTYYFVDEVEEAVKP